jgi:hypothetical protein
MIGLDEDERFVLAGSPPPIPIENPISSALSLLRRSLLPGLLRAADQNVRRGTSDVRAVRGGPGLPLLRGAAPRGVRLGRWGPPRRTGARRSARPTLTTPRASSRTCWRCPRAASRGTGSGRRSPRCTRPEHRLERRRRPRGRLVRRPSPVARGLARLRDARRSLGEIDLTGHGPELPGPVVARPIPNLPAASRDLSLVLDRATPRRYHRRSASRGSPPPPPATFRWIDRYEGRAWRRERSR